MRLEALLIQERLAASEKGLPAFFFRVLEGLLRRHLQAQQTGEGGGRH